MSEKDDFVLELVMPVLVKARDPSRIRKKTSLTLNLELEKQSDHVIVEAEALARDQKKTSS